MAFPTTPINGQIATVNGITFIYDSSANSWTRVSSALYNIANIIIASNTNTGNLNATNNVTGSIGNFTGNVFAAGIAGTTYYGQVNLGTTSVDLNRASGSQILSGVGIDGTAATATNAINTQITANTNAGTAYVTFVDKTAGNAAQNATTSLTFNPSTGNLTTYGMFTTTGVYWAGNGASFSSGGGINFTASSTAPTSPTIGSQWYDTTSDILFQYINDGVNQVWVDIGSESSNVANALVANTITIQRSLTINSANLTTAIVNGASAGVGNIGAVGAGFNTVFAKATAAQYADLAEKYTSDANYPAGTVVIFGGEKEITISTVDHDFRVAGVVSTNPAHIMNSIIDGLPIALTGKVPCQVLGPVNKGDVLVTSKISGAAEKLNIQKYTPGCVLGKSLEEIDSNELKVIEVVVGRF